MNTQMSLGWLVGMVLTGGLAASGVAQDIPSTSTVSINPAAAAPASQARPTSAQLMATSLAIQRLAQAGVGEAVILAYITNSTVSYNLTPDGIIHLKGVGVSPAVISAMIAHDRQLLSEPQPPSAVPATLPMFAVASPEDEGPSIVASDDDWPAPSIIADDEGYAPEQPPELGPVRAPYPVRLNDPIVIMKLPSFTIPVW